MITVYTKTGCGQCIATIRDLTRRGITHQTVDLEGNPTARWHVTADLGLSSAPAIEVTDRRGNFRDAWAGYRPDKIANLAA